MFLVHAGTPYSEEFLQTKLIKNEGERKMESTYEAVDQGLLFEQQRMNFNYAVDDMFTAVSSDLNESPGRISDLIVREERYARLRAAEMEMRRKTGMRGEAMLAKHNDSRSKGREKSAAMRRKPEQAAA